MIRLVVLGTSASLPTKEHLPSCFAVKFEKVLLFDACEAVQRQLMKYGVSFAQVRCVFLSHLHADHFLGLFGLVQTLNMSGRQSELLVVGPKGTAKMLETIFSLKQLKANFPIKIVEASGLEKKPVFEAENYGVYAFPVKHGIDALGYVLQENEKRRFDKAKCDLAGVRGRLFYELQEKKSVVVGKKTVRLNDVTYLQPGKKIVYTGDTSFFAGLKKKFGNADLVVSDCTFLEEHAALAKEKQHCTAKKIAGCAKAAGARKLLITHFSNRYEDRQPLLEEAKAEFAETVLAQEGLELMV
ncbi:MAG: ribonuclease Z [Candidatus Micrarchaeia archaeon]